MGVWKSGPYQIETTAQVHPLAVGPVNPTVGKIEFVTGLSHCYSRPYVIGSAEFDELKLRLDGALKRIEALEDKRVCNCSQCTSERIGQPEKGICVRKQSIDSTNPFGDMYAKAFADQLLNGGNDYNKPPLARHGQHMVAPKCNCDDCRCERRE